MESTTVVQRATGQLSTVLGSEAVLLVPDRGTYYGTNEVGTRVWAMLAEPVQVSEICSAIEAEFNVEHGECERDLVAFLQGLQREGLVSVVA